MQPSHALLAVAGINAFLTARVARPLVRADRLFFQLGFLIPYFMAASFRMTTLLYEALNAQQSKRPKHQPSSSYTLRMASSPSVIHR